MPAPNMVTVSTIFGLSTYSNVTTNFANIITNGSTSGNVIKLNTITVSNYTFTNQRSWIQIGRGSSLIFVVGNVTVPSSSTLTVLAKDTPIYLEEGDYLQSNASANVSLHLVASYEVIK